MKIKTYLIPQFFFIAFLLNNQAFAFDSPNVEIRGFGTAGVSQSNSEFTIPQNNTFGKSLNTNKTNVFGLNLHGDLFSNWDFAAQLEARGDYQFFNFNLKFGFLAWHPNSDFSIRAGRVSNLFWLYSQQIDVGLSYPWTILPPEVYYLAYGSKYINGLSFLYNKEFGSGILQSELVLGGAAESSDAPNVFATSSTKGVAEVKNAVGIDLSYELNHKLTTRITYSQGEVSVLSQITTIGGGSFGTDSLRTVRINGRYQFFGVGSKFESDTFFGSAEVVRRLITGGSKSQATGYYAMGGYHFGKWSPFYTYSVSTALVGGASYPHPNPSLFGTSVAMLDAHSHDIGLNYSLNDSVLIKTSFTRSHQQYNNTSYNLNWNTYQASINFVF